MAIQNITNQQVIEYLQACHEEGRKISFFVERLSNVVHVIVEYSDISNNAYVSFAFGFESEISDKLPIRLYPDYHLNYFSDNLKLVSIMLFKFAFCSYDKKTERIYALPPFSEYNKNA